MAAWIHLGVGDARMVHPEALALDCSQDQYTQKRPGK